MGKERSAAEVDMFRRHVPDGGIEYERVYDASDADIWVDAEALRNAGEDKESDFLLGHTDQRYWFMAPDFLGKRPAQWWQIKLGAMTIDTCNYVTDRVVTMEEVDIIASSIALFQARFPLPKDFSPRGIAITDRLRDGTRRQQGYGYEGATSRGTRSYALSLDFGAFSTDACASNIPVANMVGIHWHELAHLWWDTYLSEEWRLAGFDWKVERTSVRNQPKRVEGRIQYVPLRPEACITEYAKTSQAEDIAESITAHLGGGTRALHPAKRKILDAEDYYLPPLDFEIKKRSAHIPVLPAQVKYVVANVN